MIKKNFRVMIVFMCIYTNFNTFACDGKNEFVDDITYITITSLEDFDRLENVLRMNKGSKINISLACTEENLINTLNILARDTTTRDCDVVDTNSSIHNYIEEKSDNWNKAFKNFMENNTTLYTFILPLNWLGQSDTNALDIFLKRNKFFCHTNIDNNQSYARNFLGTLAEHANDLAYLEEHYFIDDKNREKQDIFEHFRYFFWAENLNNYHRVARYLFKTLKGKIEQDSSQEEQKIAELFIYYKLREDESITKSNNIILHPQDKELTLLKPQKDKNNKRKKRLDNSSSSSSSSHSINHTVSDQSNFISPPSLSNSSSSNNNDKKFLVNKFKTIKSLDLCSIKVEDKEYKINSILLDVSACNTLLNLVTSETSITHVYLSSLDISNIAGNEYLYDFIKKFQYLKVFSVDNLRIAEQQKSTFLNLFLNKLINSKDSEEFTKLDKIELRRGNFNIDLKNIIPLLFQLEIPLNKLDLSYNNYSKDTSNFELDQKIKNSRPRKDIFQLYLYENLSHIGKNFEQENALIKNLGINIIY